jgi:hypothetical protein
MATAKNKSKGARSRQSATAKRARGKLAPGANARGLDAADAVIAMGSPEIADSAHHSDSAGARVQIALPSQLRRGAHQPGAIS